MPTPTALTPVAPADLLPEPALPDLSRPLALHAGHAYAAAWSHLRGPRAADHALVLVRDDGELSQPLASASTLTRLPGGPPFPVERLWSAESLTAYHAGRRPDPAAVFQALTQVFDTFIDFNHSLGPQSELCELLAVYVLATWFQPAFASFPHVWILGDTGSGKSRLLHLLARLTHLGLVVPASSPAAALRDLSALGAALALDNADGLFNSLVTGETFRPGAATQRQAIFLGGARRDVLFPSRQRLTARSEPALYGLTHVDTFGPRLFAAQFAPPPAVASRAIYLPLLRSTDRARCRAHPDVPAAWPVAPRALLDDLWALALARLSELPAHVAATAARADLVGAHFETWQPLLAVADWLTAQGVPGLFDRLHALATVYPARAAEIAPHAVDRTVLALQAIYGLIAHQIAETIATRTANAQDRPTHRRRGQADQSDTHDTLPASGGSRDTHDTLPASGGSHDTHDTLPASGGSRDTYDTLPASGGSRDTRDTFPASGGSRDRATLPGSAPDQPPPARSASGSVSPDPMPLDPLTLALLRTIAYEFNASQLLPIVRGLAEQRGWHAYAAALTPTGLGQSLKQIGLGRQRRSNARFYTLTLSELERLLDAYRLPWPSPLTAYPRFAKSALTADTRGPSQPAPPAPSPARRRSSKPAQRPTPTAKRRRTPPTQPGASTRNKR